MPSRLHSGVEVAPQFTHSRPSANTKVVLAVFSSLTEVKERKSKYLNNYPGKHVQKDINSSVTITISTLLLAWLHSVDNLAVQLYIPINTFCVNIHRNILIKYIFISVLVFLFRMFAALQKRAVWEDPRRLEEKEVGRRKTRSGECSAAHCGH